MPSYCDPDYAPNAYYEDLYQCDDSTNGYECHWCDNEVRYEDEEDGTPEYMSNPVGIVDGCSCNQCERNRRGNSTARANEVWPGGIASYSHKPSPIFWSVGGNYRNRLSGKFGERTPYMGCEIEVEFSGTHEAGVALTRAYNAHSDLTERLYAKEDSSLVNGVEIVSHPMTLEAWQELYRMGELEFYRKCEEAGTASTSRCGFHIHINRSSFNSLAHQARFTALFIRNEHYMVEVAGRHEESYASFQSFNACAVLKGRGYAPRGAVNLGNNPTIEVRMFNSTHQAQTIMANLEFVHACQAYTSERGKVGCTLPIREALTFKALAEWLCQNSATYPCASALPTVRQFAKAGN